ncbi:hypothetical protein [Streptomyces massasporeus]|uniref:hypothetical protein n=1 Tax=Streptomyces massasporeus TaxID=67324 RepID=UPI0037FA4EB6
MSVHVPAPQEHSAHHCTRPGPNRGRVRLEFAVPQGPSLSSSGAVLGSALLSAGLAGGHIPPTPALVWPLVAMSVAAMAYDLGRRALRRTEHHR